MLRVTAKTVFFLNCGLIWIGEFVTVTSNIYYFSFVRIQKNKHEKYSISSESIHLIVIYP